MMYYETIADNDDQFKLEKLGGTMWLELGKDIGADATTWIQDLYNDLDFGKLSSEHVTELKEMLLKAGHQDSTQNLMKILSILATAKEKGWL